MDGETLQELETPKVGHLVEFDQLDENRQPRNYLPSELVLVTKIVVNEKQKVHIEIGEMLVLVELGEVDNFQLQQPLLRLVPVKKKKTRQTDKHFQRSISTDEKIRWVHIYDAFVIITRIGVVHKLRLQIFGLF